MCGKTDGELMELVVSGEKTAFEELVNRHRAASERFALGIVHDPELSEEIVQDCFVKLWLYRERYRTDFAFTTFLFTLIKHRALDELRKSGKRPSPIDDFPDILSEETPESLFVRKEILNGIEAKIEQLRHESGDCLYLFAVCGMKTRDIAKKLGISEANVRVRIHRDRIKLKALLKKEDLL